MHTDLSLISDYIDNIKKKSYKDIAHISNNVLNKNPYSSDFINNCLFSTEQKKISIFFILRKLSVFYLKNFLLFFILIINTVIYKFFIGKSNFDFSKDIYLIDIFFIVDRIINDEAFIDSYFPGIYSILEKSNKKYVFLPRLFGLGKSPLKFYKLIKILNKDSDKNFLLEHELLTIFDFAKVFVFIILYPVKQFYLIQKGGNKFNNFFNYELFNVLPRTHFESYIRYLIGKRISDKITNKSKIISWQEFQNLEKTFYRAIRESNKGIVVYGCEFLVKYESYLSMQITNIDVDLHVTPHITLLNGKHNYSQSDKHIFKSGASLRYKNMFKFKKDYNNKQNMLALLSSDVSESQNLLKTIQYIDKLNIKIHPTTSEKLFDKYKKQYWNYYYDSMYKLFSKANIVFVSPMSGTALEAVACGVSVIIISSPNKMIVNPLVEYGRGKIWEIVFNESELKYKTVDLLNFREKNMNEINFISNWYKENFFIDPTEENICKAFEL